VTEVYSQNFFENGEIGVSLSGAGRVRIYKDSTNAPRQIERSSILVGTGPNSVFGYNQDANNDDPVTLIPNPQFSDFELYGSANNSWSSLPPDVLNKINIYGWLTGGYIVAKFNIINREQTNINAVIGMEIIARINGSYGLESIKWLSQEKTISIYREGDSSFVGYKLLSSPLTSLSIIDWYSGYDTVDPDLWGWLTSNTIDTLFDSGGDGAVTIFSQDAVNIAAGDSSEIWVGISVGDDESEMISNMVIAEAKYNLITNIDENSTAVPSAYELKQNYPNPFNPSTKIQFAVPQTEFVSLKIYDVLGNEVSTLMHQELSTGSYEIQFNARLLSSGVYFYQLITGNYSETKKMNLIK